MDRGKAAPTITSGLEPAEIAYRLMKKAGQPMVYSELVNAVGQYVPGGNTQELAVQVYTDVNRDGRFVRGSDGLWGLQEWEPRTKKRSQSAPRLISRQRPEKRYRQLLDETVEDVPAKEEGEEGGDEQAAADEETDWYDNADG